MGDKWILAAARLRGFNAHCGNGLLEEPLSELDADMRVRVRLEIARAYIPSNRTLAERGRLFGPREARLALQLLSLEVSESMGNHDSEVVDASSVD
jgi:hypothetical protein